MSAVLAVLRRSSHQYVWIDKLAVYQKPGLLQTTLLSRMMAVYCGAHTVFAIRSCESERSRYHQRAWTLQVCPFAASSSNTTMIKTESRNLKCHPSSQSSGSTLQISLISRHVCA